MTQKTLPVQIRGLAGLEGLSRAIALPHEYKPERFPSFPALERTATMGFNMPATVSVPSGASFRGLLLRSATYPAWMQQTVSSNYAYSATWQCSMAPASSQTLESGVFHPMLFNSNTGNVTASTTVVGIAGAVATPWPQTLLAIDSKVGHKPFCYVPESAWAGVVFYSAAAPLAATGSPLVEVDLEIWQSPGSVTTRSFSAVATAGNRGVFVVTLAPSVGTWYRPLGFRLSESAAQGVPGDLYCAIVVSTAPVVTYAPSTTTAGTITVSGSASANCTFPIAWPVEFANSTLPWSATRVTASALLLTNVTQVLNKGGTVQAARVNPTIISPWAVTKDYIAGLHPAEKAFLPLETGLYTYCPPSTDLVDFYDHVDYCAVQYVAGTNSGAFPVVRLDNDAMVNVFYINALSALEQFAVNVDWHIEFRTSSTLFEIGLSTVTLEALHQAQIALAAVGFFFDNPDHKAILGKVVGAARRLLPVVSNISPQVSAALSAAKGVVSLTRTARSMLMPAKPRPTPATTSGQKSGIVAPPPQRPKVKGKKAKVAKRGKHKG